MLCYLSFVYSKTISHNNVLYTTDVPLLSLIILFLVITSSLNQVCADYD